MKNDTIPPWEKEDFFAEPKKSKRFADYDTWKPIFSPQSCVVEPSNKIPARWVRGNHIISGMPSKTENR